MARLSDFQTDDLIKELESRGFQVKNILDKVPSMPRFLPVLKKLKNFINNNEN